jgi:hypothetical protein
MERLVYCGLPPVVVEKEVPVEVEKPEMERLVYCGLPQVSNLGIT